MSDEYYVDEQIRPSWTDTVNNTHGIEIGELIKNAWGWMEPHVFITKSDIFAFCPVTKKYAFFNIKLDEDKSTMGLIHRIKQYFTADVLLQQIPSLHEDWDNEE